MKNINLFIAMSLDGYIADSKGGVDQLVGQGNDLTTYVVTYSEYISSAKIRFTDESPVKLVKKLREEGKKDIWICGGANLIQQFQKKDLINCYYITIIPTVLGLGIRLFGNVDHGIQLRLLKTQTYNGMTDLIYVRR